MLYPHIRFTEKIQIKAYTLDGLFGTCGGYIGMFLGYALIQFPQFIEFAYHTMKQKIVDLKTLSKC